MVPPGNPNYPHQWPCLLTSERSLFTILIFTGTSCWTSAGRMAQCRAGAENLVSQVTWHFLTMLGTSQLSSRVPQCQYEMPRPGPMGVGGEFVPAGFLNTDKEIWQIKS